MTPEQKTRLDNIRRVFNETLEEWRAGGSGTDAACGFELTCNYLFQLVEDTNPPTSEKKED
jgi:hypothetical protein